jgi:NAD-dependent SIR2 family protein deacetylase
MQAADQIECGSGIARRQIAHLIERGPLVVLSGAGLSTSCGIPDYRDREGRWKRPQPIDPPVLPAFARDATALLATQLPRLGGGRAGGSRCRSSRP